MIEFYLPGLAEGDGRMPEVESGHAVRVLRMAEGDTLWAVDGLGRRYECVLVDAHPKHAVVEVVRSEEVLPHWEGKITLAVAPTKNMDRMEWLAEKVVEIGIDALVLLECRHSERRRIKPERLQKIMVSAMKQSLKAKLPLLEGMMPLEEFLRRGQEGQKFVGYCDDDTSRVDFSEVFRPGEDVVLLIGPEGDFSPEEIALLFENGYRAVTFGATRLRTETAALYAVAATHALRARSLP